MFLGTLFCIIMHKLNLTVGIIPSLNVAAGLLDRRILLFRLASLLAMAWRLAVTYFSFWLFGFSFIAEDVGVSRLLGSIWLELAVS
uniref:Uncharacterized protein n=1 Tax=Nelumbo nucifera TaxID=4432 RepID=A0A822ZVF4_NELNU|nr:TPA_asm: hypothetical protein HUJ06_018417 [Nelumbo nucifera]